MAGPFVGRASEPAAPHLFHGYVASRHAMHIALLGVVASVTSATVHLLMQLDMQAFIQVVTPIFHTLGIKFPNGELAAQTETPTGVAFMSHGELSFFHCLCKETLPDHNKTHAEHLISSKRSSTSSQDFFFSKWGMEPRPPHQLMHTT